MILYSINPEGRVYLIWNETKQRYEHTRSKRKQYYTKEGHAKIALKRIRHILYLREKTNDDLRIHQFKVIFEKEISLDENADHNV